MVEQPLDNSTSSPEASSLDIEKRRLECEKLRAEIAEVSLVWWKRSGYIGSMAPILIAVIGFLSVWSTGFFDTQRAELKGEIENLKLQEEALQNSNKELIRTNIEIQEKIDHAYITLKLASAEATYALGHIRGIGYSMSDQDRNRIEAALKDVSADVSGLVIGLLEKNSLIELIVPTTEDELQALNNKLQTFPASKWAVELQPMIGPVPALLAPDGRIYNPADRKFYDKLEDIKELYDK